jgi:peptide/nickel transport system permease protein
MTLGAYVLRRMLVALLMVWLVASGALVLTRLAPGDFVAEHAELDRAAQDQLRHDLGLDRSIARQYASWIAGAVRLDFGQSYLYRRPVADLIGERALNTTILAIAALLLATIVGLPLGVCSGRRTGAISAVARVLSLVFLSMPPLIASLVLVMVAARTGWLPVGGMTSADTADALIHRLVDLAHHLPLPALALALPLAATLERLQSQALSDALGESFVRAGLARGITHRRAVWRHAWPVSLRPVLGLYGLVIGSLFSGSFIVEVVTAWPGLGRLLFDALRARDVYLVAGCAASGAAVLAAGTLTAEVLLAALDPRVRRGGPS